MNDKIDELNSFLQRSPLHQWLNCRIEVFDHESGMVAVLLPDRPELHRQENEPFAHGGVIAALADLSAHAALHAHYGHGVPTIDLRVDYLRPAALPLRASATPRRTGRTVGVADVEITDRDGRLAALGRAVFITRGPAG